MCWFLDFLASDCGMQSFQSWRNGGRSNFYNLHCTFWPTLVYLATSRDIICEIHVDCSDPAAFFPKVYTSSRWLNTHETAALWWGTDQVCHSVTKVLVSTTYMPYVCHENHDELMKVWWKSDFFLHNALASNRQTWLAQVCERQSSSCTVWG